jgi:hypothetical protein
MTSRPGPARPAPAPPARRKLGNLESRALAGLLAVPPFCVLVLAWLPVPRDRALVACAVLWGAALGRAWSAWLRRG